MEAEAREQRKIARLRRAAQLPPGKTWETLDHNVLPAALMRKLREMARGEFLEQAENALAFGLPESARATPPAQSEMRSSSGDTRCCSARLIS